MPDQTVSVPCKDTTAVGLPWPPNSRAQERTRSASGGTTTHRAVGRVHGACTRRYDHTLPVPALRKTARQPTTGGLSVRHTLRRNGRPLTKINTPSARAGCMPPAARTVAKPKPTAGSTPSENAWVSTLSRTFRAAPASCPSFMVSPTRKNTKDTPSVLTVADMRQFRKIFDVILGVRRKLMDFARGDRGRAVFPNSCFLKRELRE